MTMELERNEFYRSFDLADIAKHKPKTQPEPHQNKALKSLHDWYNLKTTANKGAILVIPTGGGKTFTAVRFICRYPLSDNYKVLWLAHTHHLLEQAYCTFAPLDPSSEKGLEVAEVRNKKKLNIRLVSGEQNHYKPADIETTDDVLICTLQTAVRAFKKKHSNFFDFIESAEMLFVVFDEAHHTPAETYSKFIFDLQKLKDSKIMLLGLTATPTYSNPRKIAWLKKLYPQGTIPEPQITVNELQAAKVLSKLQVLEPVKVTKDKYKPTFTKSAYNQWVKSFHNDIPEDIIKNMALSRERNTIIAHTYDKKQHEKTIIFADRWYQCETIKEMLLRRGVRAGAIYSHTTSIKGDANVRNVVRRGKSELDRDLQDFRKGKLDVLVNINILTEGTDVPDVKTVFITRETTSEIKLRQMIGRALRGPKFGGTEEANVVLFEDDWEFGDILSEFAALPDDLEPVYFAERIPRKARALTFISVELVKALSQLMDEGSNDVALEFDNLFPIGWYEVQFSSASADNPDDILQINKLILVYAHEEKEYKGLIDHFKSKEYPRFKKMNATVDDLKEDIRALQNRYFKNTKAVGSNIPYNIFLLGKHFADPANNYDPSFHPFEKRDEHNLEYLASMHIMDKLSPMEIWEKLQDEYIRQDRFWKTLYGDVKMFKSHYDQVCNKLLYKPDSIESLAREAVKFGVKSDDSPDAVTLDAVKDRDGWCLCCWETNGRKWQVDHIMPKYYKKDHSPENLQTLCSDCHKVKTKLDGGSLIFNFRKTSSDAINDNLDLELFKTDYGDTFAGEKLIRRAVNFYYACNAVSNVEIRNKRNRTADCIVDLNPGIRKPGVGFQNRLKSFLNSLRKTPINDLDFKKG